jgi:thioredoxin-like negative regulator of GroEL
VQDHILERLSGVRVFNFDAHQRGDIASRFGVLTVPATVVLRPDGTVAAMNHGFAGEVKLRDQLEPLTPAERIAAGQLSS